MFMMINCLVTYILCIYFRQTSKMKMSKVGNQTNSQDPQAVNSRVFVGNLNTFQCSKTDVERMFQRYGRLAGKRTRKKNLHLGRRYLALEILYCLVFAGRIFLIYILTHNLPGDMLKSHSPSFSFRAL